MRPIRVRRPETALLLHGAAAPLCTRPVQPRDHSTALACGSSRMSGMCTLRSSRKAGPYCSPLSYSCLYSWTVSLQDRATHINNALHRQSSQGGAQGSPQTPGTLQMSQGIAQYSDGDIECGCCCFAGYHAKHLGPVTAARSQDACNVLPLDSLCVHIAACASHCQHPINSGPTRSQNSRFQICLQVLRWQDNASLWPHLGTGADARWASMVLSAIDLPSFSCLFFSI